MNKFYLDEVKQFYDDRYRVQGDSIASVGWSSVESQDLRFRMLLRDVDCSKKVMLDVGCGLGDLIPFLTKEGFEFCYIGIDISSELIKAAQEKYKDNKKVLFIETDMLNFDSNSHHVDISVLSGTLSHKIEGNMTYAKAVIEKMFQSSTEVAALNFMSSYVDFKHEKNFHYNPEEMFSFGKTLTKKVNLFHDYPLYEFTLQIFK